MAFVRWTDPAGQTLLVEVANELTIGRDPSNGLCLGDLQVSRRHAVLRRTPDGSWTLVDSGSRHGTFVNGERIQSRGVKDSDELRFGDTTVVFLDRSPPARATMGVVPGAAVGEVTSTGSTVPGLDVVRDFATGLLGALASSGSGSGTARGAGLGPEAAAHLLEVVRLGRALRRHLDVSQVCDAALQTAVRVTTAERGALVLRSPDGNSAWHAHSHGSAEPFALRQTFVDQALRERVAVLAHDRTAPSRLVLCTPLMEENRSVGFLYLEKDPAIAPPFGSAHLELAGAIGCLTASEIERASMLARIREEESRRALLARFLSADVIRHLDSSGRAVEMREQEVTVLFADIQGFTALAERMPAPAVKDFLDRYLDEMTEILVDHHGGTLDKYMGDGILALFGAPFSRGTHAEVRHALHAALAMHATLRQLGERDARYHGVKIRIGINTGRAIAGMMGSQRRLEYSVVGDCVNVASRLEQQCEPGRTLVSDSTQQAASEEFDFEFAGDRQIRNREQLVKAWWLARAIGTSSVRR